LEQKQINIYLIDDEPALLKAVTQTFRQKDEWQVKCFENGEDCLKKLKKNHPDILIADINLPGLSGMDILNAVKSQDSTIPVLLITGYGDIPLAVRAVKAGAFDFIEKPFDEDTLLNAVKKALKIRANFHKAKQKGLTKSEIKVVDQISKGKTNKQIAFEMGRSVRTIENHRYRLMRKLEVDNVADLVKKAVDMGLCFTK
jgi:FixJ family two-component response regulator